MTATRRNAREWAIQMLTAADLNPPDDVPSFMEAFWESAATIGEPEDAPKPNPRARRFAEERVEGVLSKIDGIDKMLEGLLDNWELWRLGTVERAVLRMGAWEIAFGGVPAPVAINEAVDLVNWFSSPKSRAIVNGVLDNLAKKSTPAADGR